MKTIANPGDAALLEMDPDRSLALLGDRLRYMGAQLRPGLCAVMLGVYPPQLSEMGFVYSGDPHVADRGVWIQRQGGQRVSTSRVSLLEADLPYALDPRAETRRLIGRRVITRLPGGRLVTPSQHSPNGRRPEVMTALYGRWHGYLDAIQRAERERELGQISRRRI